MVRLCRTSRYRPQSTILKAKAGTIEWEAIRSRPSFHPNAARWISALFDVYCYLRLIILDKNAIGP